MTPSGADMVGTCTLMHPIGPRSGDARNPSLRSSRCVPLTTRARRFDRRTFLAAALAAGGAESWRRSRGPPRRGGAVARTAASTAPAGSDLGAVEHVVFLMQENRSFDHYFGTYPGVRGFDDHPRLASARSPRRGPAGAAPTLLPFHLDTATGIGECTYDLNHTWEAEHRAGTAATMATSSRPTRSRSSRGPSTACSPWATTRRTDLPFYYALADAFTICDGYHCSVLGPTHPNRLMALSGTIDPAGKAGGPVVITNEHADAIWQRAAGTPCPRCSRTPASAGRSTTRRARLRTDLLRAPRPLVGDNILPYFKQYKDPTSALYQKAFLPQFPSDFVTDVAHGHAAGCQLDPPARSATTSTRRRRRRSGSGSPTRCSTRWCPTPTVWSKTVLFHHVRRERRLLRPRAAADGAAGHPRRVPDGEPLPPDANGITGPIGLGFRVPMLVISPFSRGGHVASEIFDHTSQLRFLEERFGVRAPNISPGAARLPAT